eukprot:CAMPEP_0196730216 /NCGR_PEP_ID=MMETSP1091-20130531/10326_1 /TAXON_ID=302021 /ORGANISM="Rhodomonas sp., Strain CCMP768" /LENGTH=74 /DNA_ID=CAMNT_0042073175 /DNA_START=20 /DNA_END=244 /DNA_ORIENTATION=-
MLVLPLRSLMKGPTEFPAYNDAGYNTSVFAYPETLNGHDVYYNQFENIEVPYPMWSTNGTPFEENPLTDDFLRY